MYLRSQICPKLQSGERWRSEQDTTQDPTTALRFLAFSELTWLQPGEWVGEVGVGSRVKQGDVKRHR